MVFVADTAPSDEGMGFVVIDGAINLLVAAIASSQSSPSSHAPSSSSSSSFEVITAPSHPMGCGALLTSIATATSSTVVIVAVAMGLPELNLIVDLSWPAHHP
jgi:multisubunit Na+/H+ antiporter MnhC subunit